MRTAFILLKTEPARERDVYLQLQELREVIETHALYGEFDLLAKVEADSAKGLTEMLISTMRTIDGVRETQTLITVDY
jgi:DNA-binding Lrp family transcriptional regulator